MATDIYGNPVKVLHGDDAVKQVESHLGRQLTAAEKRVVTVEGYVKEPYWDTADPPVITQGVGQTGKWIERGFEASFKHHVERAKKRLPDFDDYPEYVQNELIQSEYRGDLGLSPKAMRLFKQGEHTAASKEFLNSEEYKNPDTSQGIKDRMKATADALFQYGQEQKNTLSKKGQTNERMAGSTT